MILLGVTAADKILGKMRNNPSGWRIEDLKTVAARHNISGAKLTVPARKPIKPIYVKKFLEMIDEVTHEKD